MKFERIKLESFDLTRKNQLILKAAIEVGKGEFLLIILGRPL